MIDKLYNEITNQNTNYITIISIMVAIIAIVLAVFGLFQWKFSDKQLQAVREKTKEEIIKKYNLDNIELRFNELKKSLDQVNDSFATSLVNSLDRKVQTLINVNNSTNIDVSFAESVNFDINGILFDLKSADVPLEKKIKILNSRQESYQQVLEHGVFTPQASKELNQVIKNIKSIIGQIKNPQFDNILTKNN